MFFRRDELKVLTEKIIRDHAADMEKLAKLKRNLADLRPEWEKLQRRAEEIESLRDAVSGTYAREVCEEFWSKRDEALKAELEATIRERDKLTAVCSEIAVQKERVFKRHSVVSGNFTNWVNQIIGTLPVPELATDLRTAQKKIEESQDMAKILDMVADCVEKVESASDLNLHIPLFNFAYLARQVSGVA